MPTTCLSTVWTETAYYANGSVYSKHQLGVTTLMPIKGYVASVSPSAVRVHTHGGLCVSDYGYRRNGGGISSPRTCARCRGRNCDWKASVSCPLYGFVSESTNRFLEYVSIGRRIVWCHVYGHQPRETNACGRLFGRYTSSLGCFLSIATRR